MTEENEELLKALCSGDKLTQMLIVQQDGYCMTLEELQDASIEYLGSDVNVNVEYEGNMRPIHLATLNG